MRLLGYADYEFVNDGYWASLPNAWIPVVRVDPNVIPRPGTYATLGIGVVGEMTIPARFGYNGPLAFEDWALNLLKRLNPVDTSVRQLRGVRNNGTLVAIPAVMQIQSITGGNDNEDDVNIIYINFVAVQPYWEPISALTVATQVFESDGLRQSVLLDVQGRVPDEPHDSGDGHGATIVDNGERRLEVPTPLHHRQYRQRADSELPLRH
jgi:hypothetical protein